MQERGLTSRMISYWDSIRKEKPLPDISVFNSSAIEDIWAMCIRLGIQPGSREANIYLYEHIGDKLMDAYGIDMSGKITSAKNSHLPGFKLLKQVDAAVLAQDTITGSGQFINNNSQLIKYRNCILPFGKESCEVTHIIAGMSWKAF